MKYRRKIMMTFLLALSVTATLASNRSPFNRGWRFHLGDIEGASTINFDDSIWRVIDLPHDWAFENGYSEVGAQGDRGGYTCGGIGWYRKHFNISRKEISDKRHFVCFDGVYMNSEVWINGHLLGKRPYGYVSFRYEITDFLECGANVIAVRVDNSLEPSARWYHGCGIYADVSLLQCSMADFGENSIYVTTPDVSKDMATVHFTAGLDVANVGSPAFLSVSYSVISPDGAVVASQKGISPEMLVSGLDVQIGDPCIWDLDSPDLYTLKLSLRNCGKVVSEEKVRFGIRTVSWDPETGFYLNSRRVKLRGVCEHLEGGPVGAAWTKDLLRWKLRLLKDMGCNSIRTAHNPQVPFFYDLCDEIGILVMDEIFDGWMTKARFDYGHQAFESWWERDLRTVVRRDRNHPSVFIYSVGNETRGVLASRLVRVCHEEDNSRMVTSGHSESNFMDVTGVNGYSEKKTFMDTFKPDGKAFIGTETPHTWQVRGYYRAKTWYRDGYPNRMQAPFYIPDMVDKEIFTYEWASPDKWKNEKQHYNSSYDNATVRLTARHNIEFLRDIPWYSGSYRWTGFDYLGEAGYVHGGWPFRAFMGGALDMAGFKKDLYYLYQSEWTETPVAHILPHWTHPYMDEGTMVPVVVYTNGDAAELFLNGESLGRRPKGIKWSEMAIEWLVPWKEGVIEVRAYRDGELWTSSVQTTSKEPSKLDVTAENLSFDNIGLTTVILTCAERDHRGVLYPYGENRIYFHVPDCMKGYSLENGNPTDVETNWNADSKTGFFGLLRGFFRFPSFVKEPVVGIGAILGDKRLKISDRVSIDVKALNLSSGRCLEDDYQIRYTIDGSDPTSDSELYQGSFAVSSGTLVRAKVYSAGEVILNMEERFGPDEGIWWSGGGLGSAFSLRGIQAENTSFDGMEKSVSMAGFDGDCHLITVSPEARLSYNQENDGPARRVTFALCYYHQTGRFVIEVSNNGMVIAKEAVEGTPSHSWLKASFRIPLINGANQIEITMKGDPGNGIDWFELCE